MKKPLSFLFLTAASTSVLAQGTVIFANNPVTLISYAPNKPFATNLTIQVLPPAPVGTYMYALLISPSATGPFVFSGVYATNTAAGSRLGEPNFQQAVPGWAAQTPMFFEVFGWTANTLGTTFNPFWLHNNQPNPGLFLTYDTYVGLSNVGYGTSGGGQNPPLPIFGIIGGATGVSGFILQNDLVPEPSVAALSCLGFGAWLISRWRR